MNKEFKSLIERAANWPERAQAEAARVLADLERKHGFEPTGAEAGATTSDVDRVRSRIERSLADSRPDIPLEKAFAGIERLHVKRTKSR
jgi:hypothetical protein